MFYHTGWPDNLGYEDFSDSGAYKPWWERRKRLDPEKIKELGKNKQDDTNKSRRKYIPRHAAKKEMKGVDPMPLYSKGG